MNGRITRARVTKTEMGWKALTAEFNAKLIKSQLASSREEDTAAKFALLARLRLFVCFST